MLRICALAVLAVACVGCSTVYPYKDEARKDAAVVTLKTTLNSAGFLASHEVDVDVYLREGECDFAYNGTIEEDDAGAKVPPGQALYLSVGYYRSGILSNPVNRENRVYFTPQPSRHYEVDYIKNRDGYSFKLYDVSNGGRSELEWESWRLCS